MDPVDAAVDVANGLIPPELHKLSSTTKWQLWVAGVLAVTSLGLVTHILLACGFFSFYSGFAKAGDTAALEKKVTEQMQVMEQRMTAKTDDLADVLKTQRINTLRKDLFDSRQRQCKAPSGAVRTMMTEQISSMQMEYKSLKGEGYDLPSCDSF